MVVRYTGLAAGALLLVLGAGAAAQDRVPLSTSEPYTQAASGMVFPPSIGDFQRVEVVRYNADGTDESAGYNRTTPTMEIAATVYVFRSPSILSIGSPRETIEITRSILCGRQTQAIQQEIMSVHPDATQIRTGAFALRQGGASYFGTKVSYAYSGDFAGRTGSQLHSDLYVFCYAGGTWTIEYRIDYPAEYDAEDEIARFMNHLTWTIPRENWQDPSPVRHSGR
ncbi:MAG: hypothetical protein WAU68_06625 [Vitreimonas sp.]